MLANVLSGLIPPDRGRIFFEGREITRLPMDARFRAGLARTFQIPGPYPTLTACRPKLILLDEVFSALSTKDEAELAALLRSLHRDDGISFLLISHNPLLLQERCGPL